MDDELDDPRQAAIARIKGRRNLELQAGSFALLSVVLIVVWAVAGGGFFWPVFAMIGFAFALFSQWQALQGRRPISEDEIRREMGEG